MSGGLSRLGLRTRMAASYVLVSAAAVLVVEVVLLTLVAPAIRDASASVDKANNRAAQATSNEARAKQAVVATEDAAALSLLATGLAARRPGITDAALLSAVATEGFPNTALNKTIRHGQPPPQAAEVLTAPDHRVVATSSQRVVSPGSVLNPAVTGSNWSASAVAVGAQGQRIIGLVFVRLADLATGAKPTADPGTGTKPVVAPGTNAASTQGTGKSPPHSSRSLDVDGALLLPGLVVLGLLVPVGLVFGLLSTGRLIRRIRRLAEGAASMAGGDLASRVPVLGEDEIGRLERGFNGMAEQLEVAVQQERDAAGAEARRAERTRIARELHDSVSQHLFSMNLLAGGLRRALPPGSDLHHQAESMERTVERTMHEMRAMLLELRPVVLEDAGLVAAVNQLCQAYEVRLSIRISAEVSELHVDPPIEHAVLRVVQEALANAARHSHSEVIELRVSEVQNHVVVAIRDHGTGFDPARVGERHGMGLDLMRERVTELGGTVDVASAPAKGTTVQVRIPAGTS